MQACKEEANDPIVNISKITSILGYKSRDRPVSAHRSVHVLSHQKREALDQPPNGKRFRSVGLQRPSPAWPGSTKTGR